MVEVAGLSWILQEEEEEDTKSVFCCRGCVENSSLLVYPCRKSKVLSEAENVTWRI